MSLSLFRLGLGLCAVSLVAACGGEPAASAPDAASVAAQDTPVFRESACVPVEDAVEMPAVVSASMGQFSVAVVPATQAQVSIASQGAGVVATVVVMGDARVIVEDQRSVAALDVTGTGPTRVVYSTPTGFSCE